MKTAITVFLLLFFTLNIQLQGGNSMDNLDLIPPPLKISVGKGEISFSKKIIILFEPNNSETVEYAVKFLSKELQEKFGCSVKVISGEKDIKEKGDLIYIGNLSSNFISKICKEKVVSSLNLGSEGYFLTTYKFPEGKEAIIIGGGKKGGTLYGCLTFLQLLKENKGKLLIPEDLWIEDKPSFNIRGVTGSGNLDWYARCRINAIYVGTNAINESLVKKCQKRGITPYACITFLYPNLDFYKKHKRYLSPLEESDLKIFEQSYEQAAKNGARGLILLFDDLSPDMCKYYKKNFGGLAEFQIPFIKRMIKVAKKYKIDNLIVCPTPYGSWWMKDKGNYEYFKKLSFLQKEGVRFFHCTYRKKNVEELKKAGITNYAWWYNHCNRPGNSPGLFPRNKIFGECFFGFRPLEWGWYSVTDDPREGLRIFSDVLPERKTLAERTKEAWICGTYGGQELWQWGAYLWRPEKYDPEKTFAAATETFLGKGSYPFYKKWEQIVRKWLIFVANEEVPTKEDIQKFKEEKVEAYKALDRLSTVINKGKEGYLSKMKDSLQFLTIEVEIKSSSVKKKFLSTPQLIISPCETPPVIDGKIEEKEWRYATMITGFVHHSSGKLEKSKGWFWLTYDNKYMQEPKIYIAIRTEVPPNSNLISKSGKIWEGDAIEIFLNPTLGLPPEERVFFQFVGNASGDIFECRFPPTHKKWHGNWVFKNSVRGNFWDAEVSIPLRDLGVRVYQDGSVESALWGINIIRDWTNPYRPTSWSKAKSFHNIKTMAKVTFGFPFIEGVPIVRCESLGDLYKGKSDIQLRLISPFSHPCNAKVTIRLENEKCSLREEKTVILSAGRREKVISLKGNFPLAKENEVYILVLSKDEDKIYFKREFNF